MDNAPSAPERMSLQLLEEITKDFSKQRKLGGGAYGDVYLGEHKDGEKIAVKLLKDHLDLDDDQFVKEYHNLAILDHKNVVRLVGYCYDTQKIFMPYNGRNHLAEKNKRALCFEYMPNRSLDDFINDESNGHDWCTRYAVIKGICEGLEYLHEKLESPMYHLDLKPANVLLDKNMSPKIADFGLSRLFGGEKTQMTKSAIGTHGYVPPEYIDAAVISIKFDIFSLGVVIIKTMTGRHGYFRTAEMSPQQFVERVYTDWMNRLQVAALHPYSIQVATCAEIAVNCVEADRRKRPSIGAIINSLNKMESTIQILAALRNGSDSPIDEDGQVCPCISSETKMLDILKNKLISYPLHVTDNRGRVHEVIITTVGDPAGETSTSKLVRPRIKIIDCTDGLGKVYAIDVHTTEPWILACHYADVGVNFSIWNHQNQTRVMAFHDTDMDSFFAGDVGAKFMEPLQCFLMSDTDGYIHVYSYEKVDKVHKFLAHEDQFAMSMAVHPSEPFVLTASCGQIKLWNGEACWQCIRTFDRHFSDVDRVWFIPQTAGNTFAGSAGSTIKEWNIDSPTPVASWDDKSSIQWVGPRYYVRSGDRRYLVGTSWGKGGQILDLHSNKSIRQIDGLQKEGHGSIVVVESLLGHPILVTVSEDHTVAFCDTTSHRYENRVNFNLGRIYDFAYIDMTTSLLIVCEDGIAIMEID